MRESTEITLLGFSCLILVSPILAEVALTKRLASGICSQFKIWKNTKEIPPPLKSAKKALETDVPCSFLERKGCTGDANCVPFHCTGSGSTMGSGSVNSIAKGGSPGIMAMSAKSGSKTRMTNAPAMDPHAAIEVDGKWNRIAAGQPGSPFGNPNNPNNLTFHPCVSPKNPYNKWKGGRKRRGTDDNEAAEEFVDDFPDDDLQGYLTKLGAPKKERIIGGSNATDNLFPYAARIAFCVKYCYWDHKNSKQNTEFSTRSGSWNETRRCTGIILNKWYVLTSGSCGRWLNHYRLALKNPDLKLPIFDCDPKTNPLCPTVPESYQYLTNLTDIFLYFGEFQYNTGEKWIRQRRSVRSVVVSCETDIPFVQSDTYAIVELFAYLNYKEPSFWPLYLSNVTRKVRDSIPNSPTYNKQVDEGRPFRQVNGKIRALFVGWGNTNADKLEWSNYLKYIRMNIISPEDTNCFNMLARTFYVPQEAIRTQYFCAKFDDSETSTNNALCRGDVGGPLVCETETGYERLCGILTTTNITGTYRPDSGTCNPKIALYPFHNMTTNYNILRVATDIRRPAQGKQQGWKYRVPGKWLQDEEETLSFTQWRTFERTWGSQGVKT